MPSTLKSLFLIMLTLGTLMTLSASTWMTAWMGLEINLMAFIPLMSSSLNQRSSEATMKYFLTQALGSAILMMALILSTLTQEETSSFTNQEAFPNILLLNTALILKLGAAPFHYWFPPVMEGLSWPNCMLLMTWQKMAPLSLIYLASTKLLILASMLSALAGALGGFNQTSLRKLLAYSSISHMAWMFLASMINMQMLALYFILYSMITLSATFTLLMMKLNILSQTLTLHFNPLNKIMLALNLMSLGGLPPFLGFLPKWLIIQSSMASLLMFPMIFLILSSLITLFFYLRITYSSLMISYDSFAWTLKNTLNLPALASSSVTLTLPLLITLTNMT